MTKELRHKIFAQSLLAISQAIFPLITYPVITEALGASGLGSVQFADGIAQIILLVASVGIPLYGIREIASRSEKKQQDHLFWELFILQSLFVLPAVLIMWFIGNWSQIDNELIFVAGIGIVASCLSCEWYFLGKEKFWFLAARSVLIKAIAALAIFLLVHSAKDVLLYYVILVGSVMLTTTLNLGSIFARTKMTRLPLHLKQHFFGAHTVYVVYLFASLYSLADVVILGWLSTNEAVGIYAFGYKLVRMCAMFIISIGVVFIPRIAQRYNTGNKNRVAEETNTSQQAIFFFGIPAAVFFFVLAPEIVAVLGSPQFALSIAVIRILSATPLLLGLSHLAGIQLLMPQKKEKIYLQRIFISFVAGLCLNFILIPQLAQTGAAIAALCTESVLVFLLYLYLLKNNLIQLQLKLFAITILLTTLLLPFVFLFRYLQWQPLWVLIGSAFFFGFVYVLLQVKMLPQSFVRLLCIGK